MGELSITVVVGVQCELGLMRGLENLVMHFQRGVEPLDEAGIRRAVDWLHSKYGRARVMRTEDSSVR